MGLGRLNSITMSTEAQAQSTGQNVEVESIWLTKPSIKPIVLAAALACAVIGLFGFRPLLYAAVVVVAITTVAWITDSRNESDELPLS